MGRPSSKLGDHRQAGESGCHRRYRLGYRCWIMVVYEISRMNAALDSASLGFEPCQWPNSLPPHANYVFPCLKILDF